MPRSYKIMHIHQSCWWRRGSGLSHGFQSSWWDHAQDLQRDLGL